MTERAETTFDLIYIICNKVGSYDLCSFLACASSADEDDERLSSDFVVIIVIVGVLIIIINWNET